jgi:hypothetical protein
MACAMVRSALAEAVDYGAERESFGRSLLDHQGLRWSLADVANHLEAAEALTAYSVDVYEAGLSADEGDPMGIAIAAAHAKKFTAQMLEPCLRACMQAMGAEGLRSGNRVGRLLSEARIASYVDGTTEMQTDRIGRSLTAEYGGESLGPASVAYRIVSEGRGDFEELTAVDEAIDHSVEPATDDTTQPDEAAEDVHPDGPSLFDHGEVADVADGDEVEIDEPAESASFFGRHDESPSAVVAAASVTASMPPNPAMPPMPPPSTQFDDSDESPLSPSETAEGLAVGFDQDHLVPPMPPVDLGPPADPPPLPPADLGLPAGAPPLPPPSTLLPPPPGASDSALPAPPLPGEEHRVDLTSEETVDETDEETTEDELDADLQPSAPPLPPESLRQGE